MIYKLNQNCTLKTQYIKNGPKVAYITFGNAPQKSLVLDETAIIIISAIEKIGFFDTENNDNNSTVNQTLLRLEQEEIIFAQGSLENTSKEPCSPDNLHFWIQTSDKCNLACTYCYIPSLNSTKKMRPDLFMLLGNKLLKTSGLKTVTIKLAGGEPLLCFYEWHKQVLELKEILEGSGIDLNIRIITNLTYLNQEIIEFITQNEVMVSVSLDGLEKFNDANRIFPKSNTGSFYIVERNLIKLKENGIKPSVMTTVTSENRDGLQNLVEYLTKGDYSFRIADAKGGHIKSTEFSSAIRDSFSTFESAIQDGFEVENKLVISDLRTLQPKENPCSMGTSAAAIYLNGDIYFCHTEFEQGTPLGSLDEDTNIISLIKRGSTKQSDLHEDCLKCEYRYVCAGGCPLYRINGKSPMCSAYKEIIPQVFKLYEQANSK